MNNPVHKTRETNNGLGDLLIFILMTSISGAATLLLLSDCYKPRNNQKVSDREEASNKEARNSKRFFLATDEY